MTVLILAVAAACGGSSSAGRQLAAIKQRGHLVCGVAPGVAGFSIEDGGRLSGFDVDLCRAVAAAIFGNPDLVRFAAAGSVGDFTRSRDIDIVSRRLTWSLTRESPGLLFGPVTFYDGQGFLVSKRLHADHPRRLSGVPICVEAGTAFESNLGMFFSRNELALEKILLRPEDDARQALRTGRCQAYTGDISELGALRSTLGSLHDEFQILPEAISKEPLAQAVRQEDIALFDVLRWTVFAMIGAEEMGITSTNVDEMLKDGRPDVRRLLGVVPGNGRALSLDERWAYNVVKRVGNYGEVFERNLGSRSPIGLERGPNRLWTDGGLIFAPPLR